jgi:hypothetical protein
MTIYHHACHYHVGTALLECAWLLLDYGAMAPNKCTIYYSMHESPGNCASTRFAVWSAVTLCCKAVLSCAGNPLINTIYLYFQCLVTSQMTATVIHDLKWRKLHMTNKITRHSESEVMFMLLHEHLLSQPIHSFWCISFEVDPHRYCVF